MLSAPRFSCGFPLSRSFFLSIHFVGARRYDGKTIPDPVKVITTARLPDDLISLLTVCRNRLLFKNKMGFWS